MRFASSWGVPYKCRTRGGPGQAVHAMVDVNPYMVNMSMCAELQRQNWRRAVGPRWAFRMHHERDIEHVNLFCCEYYDEIFTGADLRWTSILLILAAPAEEPAVDERGRAYQSSRQGIK